LRMNKASERIRIRCLVQIHTRKACLVGRFLAGQFKKFEKEKDWVAWLNVALFDLQIDRTVILDLSFYLKG
jgi:type IV secretory pathway VirD2 relaxase